MFGAVSSMKRIVLFFLICMGVFFVSCRENVERKSTVRVNFPMDPNTLDPRKGRDITSSCIHTMLYEGLTRLTPDSTSDLGLAERIEISDDRRTYTFFLRDALWSDGHPVISEDFAYAWRSMLEPDFPCPNVNLLYGIKNAEKAKRGEVPLSNVGIRTDGPKKFIVELETPIPYFLEITAFCVFYPIPSHIAQINPNWPDKNITTVVSCGPYFLLRWSHWDEMIMEKSHTYWDHENVNHDQIHMSFIENQNTAYQMYERGDLDMMGTAFTNLPLDAIPMLQKKGILESFNVAATTFCCFNTEIFPFHNKNIRKAFALAINRNDLVENITQLDEEPGISLIPSVLRHGEKRSFIKDASYEEAKEYLQKGLDELGITSDGLEATLIYAMNDTNHKLAQELQQQWHRVLGIFVELQNCERTIFLDNMQRSNFSIGLAFLHAQYNDQMNILERFRIKSNPKNYCNWENEHYATLLTEAMNASDEKIRFALMEDAEKTLLEEVPLTPIFHWSTTFVKQPYVENISFSPLGAVHLPSIKIHK